MIRGNNMFVIGTSFAHLKPWERAKRFACLDMPLRTIAMTV